MVLHTSYLNMANMGAWKKLGYGFASHDNYD